MGFLKKKGDPISDRARSLNAEIAALQTKIHQLNSKIEEARVQPKLRSTALPPGDHERAHRNGAAVRDPIFETVDPGSAAPDGENSPAHYNDLGVRKYDLAAAWRKLATHFKGPTSNNPKLVSYLAAGSIKGLRPLRYEKRVARNRFMALFIFFVLLLSGLISIFLKRHSL